MWRGDGGTGAAGLGRAKAVEAPEKSLAFEETWAWISMPITSSQSCFAPAITLGAGAV